MNRLKASRVSGLAVEEGLARVSMALTMRSALAFFGLGSDTLSRRVEGTIGPNGGHVTFGEGMRPTSFRSVNSEATISG